MNNFINKRQAVNWLIVFRGEINVTMFLPDVTSFTSVF